MPHDYYLTPDDYERAKQNGISERQLNERYYYELWNKERAITEPIRSYSKNCQFRKQAIENGISIAAYDTRVRRGWSKERASTEPINSRDDSLRKARESGRRYPKWVHDNLRKYGIKYETFYSRMNKDKGKWTLQEASTTPPQKRKRYTKNHTWNTYIKNDVDQRRKQNA